jgi:hypothetical protein
MFAKGVSKTEKLNTNGGRIQEKVKNAKGI